MHGFKKLTSIPWNRPIKRIIACLLFSLIVGLATKKLAAEEVKPYIKVFVSGFDGVLVSEAELRKIIQLSDVIVKGELHNSGMCRDGCLGDIEIAKVLKGNVSQSMIPVITHSIYSLKGLWFLQKSSDPSDKYFYMHSNFEGIPVTEEEKVQEILSEGTKAN